jgi:hypothetical protein
MYQGYGGCPKAQTQRVDLSGPPVFRNNPAGCHGFLRFGTIGLRVHRFFSSQFLMKDVCNFGFRHFRRYPYCLDAVSKSSVERLSLLTKYLYPDDFVRPLMKGRFAVFLLYKANRVPNVMLPFKYRHRRRFL